MTGLESDETQVDGSGGGYNVSRIIGYDALGRRTSIMEASGSGIDKTTTTQYDDVNRTVTVTTPLDVSRSLVTVNSYDELGRLVKTQTPDDDGTLNIAVDRLYRSVPDDAASYEAVSNPYCVSTTAKCSNSGVQGWTRTKRDRNGRVVEVQTFDGAGQPEPWGTNRAGTGTVTTAYSAEAATVTDQANKARKSSVDAAGRLVTVVENANGTPAAQVTTRYGYDALNNLTGVNPGGGTDQRERTFVYDSLKRLSSAANPESGTTSYTYDGNGNVATRTDARGVVTGYSYDSLNRVYLKSYTIPAPAPGESRAAEATENVTYCYDGQVAAAGDGACTNPGTVIPYGWNRLTEVRTATSKTTYTSYDALGRATGSTQTTGGVPYTLSYTYNLAGGLTNVRYPSNRNMSYTYTGAGQVEAVWKGANGTGNRYAKSLQYTPHGALLSMQLDETGLSEGWTYNSRLQPVSTQLGSLLTLGYSYCPGGAASCATNNGNVQQQTITAGAGFTRTIDYTYTDPLNRLSSAAESGGTNEWSETYGYDNHGNRWVSTWSPALPPSSETPTTSNWFDTKNRLTEVSYDGAGNQKSMAGFGMMYDAENRQKSMTIGTAVTHYAYDGDGRRVQKVSGGTTTTYVYTAQGQLAAEYGGAVSGGGTQYLTADNLGSTRLVTDGQGAVIKRYDYRPFGEDIPTGIGDRTTAQKYGVSDPTTIRFTGKERGDATTEDGLDYFGARYFSGAQGRFTSPDPQFFQKEMLTDPQRFNLYAYGRNNPLKFIDPSGEAIELSSDPEKRKQEMAALCGVVGETGCKYLYVDDTAKKGHYYVGIYSGGPTGRDADFGSLSGVTSAVQEIIRDQHVATLEVVQGNERLDMPAGVGKSLNINHADGAAVPADGQFHVYVRASNDPKGYDAIPFYNMSNWWTFSSGAQTQDTVLAHELGHLLYDMKNEPRLPSKSNAAALSLENQVRRAKNPKAPTRTGHDPIF